MVLKKLVREMSFYPTCFDDPKEKNQKQADRLKVNLKSYPSGLSMSKYKQYAREGKKVIVEYNYVDMMLNHVKSIENLSIGNDKIVTAVELCDYEDSRLYDLMVDIRDKLFDESEEIPQGEGKDSE